MSHLAPGRKMSYAGLQGTFLCLLGVIIVSALAGCGTTAPNAGTGKHPAQPTATLSSVSISDQAVPPIVLRNPSPDQLDVTLSVTIDQQIGDAQPQIEVGLGFESQGKTVQFSGDEHVSCDGATVDLKNRYAIFQVFRAPATQVVGKTVHCDYTVSGTTAGFSLEIPQAPMILSPKAGSQVVRNQHTIVTFQCDPATCTMIGVVALAPSSPSPKNIAKLGVPGPMQAEINTAIFAPGEGSLALTTSLTPHVATTGAAFKSVRAFGSVTVSSKVTWV
jgi:hypothetical protein